MKINVCGGGPSGLYFALLAKKYLPNVEKVTVYEQNPRDATFGFGIVLADRGLDRLKRADQESHDLIVAASFQSRNRIMSLQGRGIFIEGGGYGGAIARLRLLQILQECCDRAGIEVHYNSRLEIGQLAEDADLLVGADGVNSAVRKSYDSQFGTTSYNLTARLAWYGTHAHFPYPILSFKKTDLGYFWAAAYAYTETTGTFVAECDGETWKRSGLAEMNEAEACRFSEEIFAEELQGEKLICNKSLWNSVPVTRVKNWSVGNRVLIGDALHSAHPSIGSGTRIAMEDAIALFEALRDNADVAQALAAFRRNREPTKQKLVSAAEKSIAWYESVVPRIDSMDAVEFVFDFMMRTGRIDEARLTAEYPRFMAKYQSEWLAFNNKHAPTTA
ncbi:MAG: FAD-dependent monooxygenase [Porticoccaceae bacterium]